MIGQAKIQTFLPHMHPLLGYAQVNEGVNKGGRKHETKEIGDQAQAGTQGTLRMKAVEWL